MSLHFEISDFACPCCGALPEGEKLINLVAFAEWIRGRVNAPVNINSAFRCDKHNKEVGGVEGSTHTRALGLDVSVKGKSPKTVAKLIEGDSKASMGGLGVYKTFVHVDMGLHRRW